MKFLKLTLCAGLLLSACATTPAGPQPAWNLEPTAAAKRAAMWNYDGNIPTTEGWPGYHKCSGGIVGFKCNVGTIDRALKAKKLNVPQEYASIYTDKLQADALERLIEGTYVLGTVPPEEMGVFLASKYGQRYLRSNYVHDLAKECGEKLSKSERRLLSSALVSDPDEGQLPAYVCKSNSAFNEKPLPVHTNTNGFDLDAAMGKDNV